MPVTLRIAEPLDAPEVYRLIRELAVYEKLDDRVPASADDIRNAMQANDPRVHVILAETDAHAPEGASTPRRAVAFALYFFTFSTFEGAPTLYLEDVFVEPEARGQGIGLSLLGKLAEIARERGCRRMEWTALDWNAPALSFYRKLGAITMDDWITHRLETEGIERLARGGPG